MAVKIGHASIDERGKASGGQVGDQTGKEVCIRDWYPGSGSGWNVMLVCTDAVVAQQAAAYMKAICEDDDFGYDQGQRATGYLSIVKTNGKTSTATPGEFDCSSLVASCYKLAGLNVNHQCTTRNLRKALLNTGKFVEYTDSVHLKSDAYAVPGAVYLKEGSHVVMALGTGSKASGSTTPSTPTFTVNVSANEATIWNFFKGKGFTDYAVAGLMGNLYAESGLSQINLQNTGNKKLGLTDAEYTAKVDEGSYLNFIRDSQGYGLAQWTYWSRKQNLYNFAKQKNKSIGDLNMQLEFLYKELSTNYKGQLEKINKATSVLEASNVILKEYERPANQGTNVQNKRASYGQNYYDKYAKASAPTTPAPAPAPVRPSAPTYVVGKVYTLQVELKVRTAAGTSATAKKHSQLTVDGRKHDKDKDGALDKGTQVTCQAVKTVGTDIWIKAPSGWMAAYYRNQYYIK